MKQYLELVKDILENGEDREDRTGVGTLSVFGRQMRFNLQEGFPILTTRKTSIRIAFEELMFMLNGKTQTKELEEKNIKIWTGNTSKAFQESVGLGHLDEGDMGKLYGYQLRNFNSQGVDQLKNLVEGLKNDPYSRRHVMTYLNPAQVKEGVLWPCHILYQCYVSKNKLSSSFYMRSSDFFFGAPYNLAYYALMTHLLAELLGYDVGDLVYQAGDVHLYKNQIDLAKEQLKRIPRELPKLNVKKKISTLDDLLSMEFSDIELIGYDPYPDFKNKPPMAV